MICTESLWDKNTLLQFHQFILFILLEFFRPSSDVPSFPSDPLHKTALTVGRPVRRRASKSAATA